MLEEPWEEWLGECFVCRFRDHGSVERVIYQSQEGFTGVEVMYPHPVMKERINQNGKDYLLLTDVYSSPPSGEDSGNYLAQIYDPLFAGTPMFEKRYRKSADCRLALAVQLYRLGKILSEIPEDAWDGLGKYYDYDTDEWIVRS